MTLSTDREGPGVEGVVSLDQATSEKRVNATPSLSKDLLQLPRYYLNALLRPSISTYSRDKGNASWRLVWIQLTTWAILDVALGVLVNLISPPATGTAFVRFFAFATSYGLVVIVPLLFFLLMGVVHLLARYFGGQGSFLELCNSSLYIQAPLGILSKLLALIPGVGRILNSVLSLYGIALQVFVIMTVHRVSRGKAIATILIPLVTIGAIAGAVFLLVRK